MMLKTVQIGNSWFNAGEIHVFGRDTCQRLYASGSARPHRTMKPQTNIAPAKIEDKQSVTTAREQSDNRQLGGDQVRGNRPRLTLGGQSKRGK